MIPEAEIERLIRINLSAWRQDPDYDDMVQVARLAVWRAEQHPELSRLQASTLVGRAARWAASEYRRAGQGSLFGAPHGRRGGPRLQFASLDRPLTEDSGERDWTWLRGEDFAPALIERLAGEAEGRRCWQLLLAQATPRERQYLVACYRDGQTNAEMARRFGVTPAAVTNALNWSMNRLRAALGIPERGYGWTAQRARKKRA